MLKSRRLIIAVSTALLIGVGGPVLDLAVKCERSRLRVAAACPTSQAEGLAPCPATSEACVWGKALLPVSVAAALLLLGLPTGVRAYWWTGRNRPASGSATDGGA